MIEIKNNSGAVIYRSESASTVAEAISEAARKRIDLSGASLSGAFIVGASLNGIELSGADLSKADLYGASLMGANLYKADLSYASLYQANLSVASLGAINIRGANLTGANLYGSNLSGAKTDRYTRLPQFQIPQDGTLVGWKKLRGKVICRLLIPARARRTASVVGRKCRAEYAKVLEGSGYGIHDGTRYTKGRIVRPDSYDPNPLVECTHGIHFFLTREEAEEYRV